MPRMHLMITDVQQQRGEQLQRGSQQGWKESQAIYLTAWEFPQVDFTTQDAQTDSGTFQVAKLCSGIRRLYLKLLYDQQLKQGKLRERNQGYGFVHKTRPYN